MQHFGHVYSMQTTGIGARIVSVEVDITKGTLYAFSVVGLPDKAVEEARDRVSAAIKNSNFPSPKQQNQKTVISLAPADVKKEGPAFDLSMALAYLLAAGIITFDTSKKLFLGELSLDGTLRPIKGAVLHAQKARQEGFDELYLPSENAREAALITDIAVYPIKTLAEVVAHLNNKKERIPVIPQEKTMIPAEENFAEMDLSDIRGQESAKRALEIAAAGGHNIALYGPPGTGKTMLARACAGLLPSMPFDNMLEVTGIHSVAGVLHTAVITHPPFRAPHHTSSYTSIVGGGALPKPGEVTLAHRGILFLDEFPEFETRVLEALRQPLEDKEITIARARGSEVFPANVILVAAMNPCPCGNRGSEKPCTCNPGSLARYERKLSGPIMDRIDLWSYVGVIDHMKLSGKNTGESSSSVRERVARARHRQTARFSGKNTAAKTNSDMSARDIETLVALAPNIVEILNASAKKIDLSARSYHKIIKIARTIADLADEKEIAEHHILEALQYRPRKIV